MLNGFHVDLDVAVVGEFVARRNDGAVRRRRVAHGELPVLGELHGLVAAGVYPLADYFLAEFARAYGRRPKHFSESALGALERYRWPGNVRELRNLVERMVIMVAGDRIELRHLPPGFHHERTAAGGAVSGGFSNLQEARAAYERDYILRKLEENHGNVSRTAEVLGLERSHLYRKMKSLGIAAGE